MNTFNFCAIANIVKLNIAIMRYISAYITSVNSILFVTLINVRQLETPRARQNGGASIVGKSSIINF